MEEAAINQQLFKAAIDLYHKQSKPSQAIEKLNKILDTDKNSFIYSFKARILKDTGKLEEALKVIDEGLGHDLKSHILLQLKAEILAFNYLHLPPDQASTFLQQALGCVNQALMFFEESNQTMKEILKTLPDYPDYLSSYIGTKVDLKALETNIRNLIGSVYVLSRVNNVEKQLEGERIRTIELLGVFTAIMAFIFSSVQIITKIGAAEALVLVVGVALLLISFLLALHMVIDPNARKKHLYILLAIQIVVLLGLPWYVKQLNVTKQVPTQIVPIIQKAPELSR